MLTPKAQEIFQLYLKRSPTGEVIETIEQSFERVAYNIAAHDEHPYQFGAELLSVMKQLDLLPNRPAWFGLGRTTGMASACTMLDMSDDLARERDGIGYTLLDILRIQQAGSGVGLRVDRLRPKGAWISRTGGKSTGPCGFLRGFNSLLSTVQQGGYLQGANNAAMLVSHPDIRDFISLKLDEAALDQYNTNVFLTDEFLRAVESNDDFDLTWGGEIWDTVLAQELFNEICYAMWVNGGIGVQFYDTVQKYNAIPGYSELVVSNPCGEFYGFDRESCCPSYINLVHYVSGKVIDWDGLARIAQLSTQMLDNLIDANRYIPAIPKLEKMAKSTRRAGTGITGLADMLILLGLHYDSPEARGTAAQVMEWILYSCMKKSIQLAETRSSFPLFRQSIYASSWQNPNPPTDCFAGYRHPLLDWPNPSKGIRNCGLTVIAPSSFGAQTMNTNGFGCEPIFASAYTRNLSHTENQSYASGLSNETCFITALELSPLAHIKMVASLQPFITESISKTVNLPLETTVDEVANLVMDAWRLGLKSLIVYRSGSRDVEVLCPACQIVQGE